MRPSKKQLVVVSMVLILIGTFSFVFYWSLPRTWSYSTNLYSLKMDSVIRNFYINHNDVCSQFQMFQVEEDYQLQWQLETPIRYSTAYGNTIFTYSHLYTYDCYKTFIFGNVGFTAEIDKAYTVSGFCDNNQIIVDVKNEGFAYNETSFTFLGGLWNLTISVIRSNPTIQIQPPAPNTTELQFNFNGLSDRDIGYHNKGDLETVLFNVTIQE
jgi:hypothetical protein